jgi:hypothetical protein
MTKTICDICGKEMPLEIISKRPEDCKFCISSYGRVWDICDECRNDLNEWMEKRRRKNEN